MLLFTGIYMGKLRFIHNDAEVTDIYTGDIYVEKVRSALLYLFISRNDIYDSYNGEFIVRISGEIISYIHINYSSTTKIVEMNDPLINKVLAEIYLTKIPLSH